MFRYLFALLLSFATVVSVQAESEVFPIDKVHADSPFKFLEIWSPSNFQDLIISPDGKHFAGVEYITGYGSVLHLINRADMKVFHTEKYEGDVTINSVTWYDNDQLMFVPARKSLLSEGRGGYGLFLLNIHTKAIKPLYGGDTTDYGGWEGVSLGEKIDHDNFYLYVQPSGASPSKIPFMYLYRLNVPTGRATRIMRSPSRGASFIIKSGKNGEPDQVTHAVGFPADDWFARIVHERVGDKWKLLGKYKQQEGAWLPVGWSSMKPNTMQWVDTRETSTGAYYWVDMETGKRELIYHDPKVEIDSLRYSRTTGEVVAAHTSYDYPKWNILDPKAEESRWIQKFEATFPGSVVSMESATSDELEYVLRVRSDQNTGTYYLYNYLDDKVRPLLNPRPWVDSTKVPKMHAVNYKARDGMDLVAYLTVPQHKPMKNLPLIILPHGGPHGPRDDWGFNTEAATFANAGYAVLQINYRGSGGYGRDFEFQWYKHWGLEMQDDLEDGLRWAVQAGIANPDKVCIYGASYGGYAALMGVVKTPDLYKCAIGYVGVYDLQVQVEDSDTALSEAGQRYLVEALGTDRKDLDARSSTPNAHRIKAPVFLVEGMLDSRVHPKNYWGMRDALKARKHRFETLEIPRAGHGAGDIASHREIYCRMIDFFDRYIGPRKPDDAPLDCTFPGGKALPYQYYDGTYYDGSH